MTYLPEPYPTLADFVAKIKEWGFTEQAGVGLTRRNDARKYSASKPYHGVIKLPCRGDLGRCAQTHISTACMILRVKPKEFWAGPQAEETPVLPRVAPKAPKAAAPRKVKLGQSITATVLSTISQSAGPLGFADIAKLCTERGFPVDPKQVSTACAVLAQGGHIIRVRSGMYRAPAPTAVSSNRLDIHVVPTPTSDTASEDGPEAVTETVTGAANESVMALAPIAASRPDPLPANSREIYERCFPEGLSLNAAQFPLVADWMEATQALLDSLHACQIAS